MALPETKLASKETQVQNLYYESILAHPALIIWPLLPANENISYILTSMAHIGPIEELAFIASSNLAILSHPVFNDFYPNLSPFHSFISVLDTDIILKPRYDKDLPESAGNANDSFDLADTFLCISPYGFLKHFPTAKSSIANPDRFVCKTSLPNYGGNLDISLVLTKTLHLKHVDEWIYHQPVSFLPMTVFYHERYRQKQYRGRSDHEFRTEINLVWPKGGMQDLQNHLVRIPNQDTFLNTQPPLDTLTRLLILAKYASIMPNAILDSDSFSQAKEKASELIVNCSPNDFIHLKKRTLDMVENLAAATFNNPNAIGDYISLLTYFGIPHQPDLIISYYETIKNSVFDTQAKLANNMLQTFNQNKDFTQFGNLLPEQYTVIPY